MGGHKVILRHDLVYRTIQLALEAEVTVGDDTYQTVAFVDHRNTTDMILRHDIESLSHRRA